MGTDAGASAKGNAVWKQKVPWLMGFFLALYIAYRVGAPALVTYDNSRAAHDADGVLMGAQPFTLGKRNAKTAVLFVHGFVGAVDNFADLPDLLVDQGYLVRTLRLPGHGTRPQDMIDVPPGAYIEAVETAVKELRANHERVVIVAHSMGGAISTIVASRTKLDGLILGAPYFGVTYRWYYGLRPETWSALVAPILPWVYKGKLFLQVNRKEVKDQITSYRWIPARGSETLIALGKQANDDAVLSAITCPVLLLHAPGDVAASPEKARSAFDRMASEDKEWVDLPKSNHHIYWDYDRERVVERITHFLRQIAEEH